MNLEELIDYFYIMVTEGRGDGARGRSFHTLYTLELGLKHGFLSYESVRKPNSWLAEVFDLLSDHKESYGAKLHTGGKEELKKSIRKRIAITWKEFIDELKNSKLERVAQVTNYAVIRGLEKELGREIVKGIKFDEVSIYSIFKSLPKFESSMDLLINYFSKKLKAQNFVTEDISESLNNKVPLTANDSLDELCCILITQRIRDSLGKTGQKRVEDLIREVLGQKWKEVFTSLESVDFPEEKIQTIEKFLLKKVKHQPLENMSVIDIFTSSPKHKTLKRDKHPIGKTLRKEKITPLIDPVWCEAISELYEQEKYPSNISFIELLASIPPSGRQIFELIRCYRNPEDDEYDDDDYLCSLYFAHFYVFATDIKKKGGSQIEKWNPSPCFVDKDLHTEFEQETFRIPDLREESITYKPRHLELIKLGIGGTFPRTIKVTNNWLENCDWFKELHYEKDCWCQSIDDNKDPIHSEEARIIGKVASKLKKFDLKKPTVQMKGN